MSNTRSAASFDVSYTTSKSSREIIKLPEDLVDVRIENCVTVEVGGWGTVLKINVKRGSKVKLETNSDLNLNEFTLYVTPPKDVKSSLMTQNDLNEAIAGIVSAVDA